MIRKLKESYSVVSQRNTKATHSRLRYLLYVFILLYKNIEAVKWITTIIYCKPLNLKV